MRSLHWKLFSKYAVLLLVIVAAFMASLYILLGRTVRDNALGGLQADCDNLSTLLDTQMSQVNELSKRIVSSSQLRSLFLEDLYSGDQEAFDKKKQFSDALFDMIKLSFTNMALNMLDTQGRYIHVGNVSEFHYIEEGEAEQVEWFVPTLEAYGKPVILPTRVPEFSDDQKPVISLCRAFSPGGAPYETAVLELQISYSYMEQKIRRALYNPEGKKEIFIYDQNGGLVYPYDVSIPAKTEECMLEILGDMEERDQTGIFRPDQTSPYLIACRSSAQTSWTVFVASREQDLMAAFYRFQILILVIACMVLMLTLFLTYHIADHLSKPLRRLEQRASSLTLDNLDQVDFSGSASDFRELNSLYRSFDQMRNNLKNSLDEVVAVHTMATNAKILALQSQMNPHFLYNTLATIGVLAEEGEQEKIVETCSDLSMLLRYISSGSSNNVLLWQEMEHTRSYMQLMKNKYEDRLQFAMDIPETLRDLPVPRLIIQPLVENCIKYALKVKPPWRISVQGYEQDGTWRVEIRDNGPGFSPEYLSLFEERRRQITLEKPLPELEISGMGLLNLYARLLFLYKEQLIFQLENPLEGGASVVIGGPLQMNEGEKERGEEKNPGVRG